MARVAKWLALMASVLVMSACGLEQYVRHTDVSGYPYRYTDFDFKYAWKTTPTTDGVVIDGVMKNIRYPTIDDLELTVFVLGKQENVITRAITFPVPQQGRDYEETVNYFSLPLRGVTPVSGNVYEFLAHYKGGYGGNKGGVEWRSTFKVDAMTGAVMHRQPKNPDIW
ncbi:MAG TPA: hypothetical protein VIH45_09635 [Desulfuromonadaceae bacterium]